MRWTDLLNDDWGRISFLLHRPALSKVLSSSRSSKKFMPLNTIPEQGSLTEPISPWNDGCFWLFSTIFFAFFPSSSGAWTHWLVCFLSDLFNLRWSMHSFALTLCFQWSSLYLLIFCAHSLSLSLVSISLYKNSFFCFYSILLTSEHLATDKVRIRWSSECLSVG